MNKQRLLLLTGRTLVMLMTLIPSTGCDMTSKLASYEVTIPKKLEAKDGREMKGYVSYAIKIQGKAYIVHLTQNRASLSPNFTVFTYTDEGAVHAKQPFIRNDCYYQGTIEGIKDSTVALSTCSGLRPKG
ncbi:disintegrin and metalloproteinase domain-containing protein 20-like isoform X2 [Rhinatrema bivittatum]|uniref:disintegrin and metalloproteinase domain-containing protein 20-like isoform X2 n=1 Tax=Rhinatrema bivittatum TaxID=194408 RepID=UPI001129895D|nr:disintegrin and metalloproteinase domain-containing protein 20-like isoform X2 [Rhinatrema bivittatum]